MATPEVTVLGLTLQPGGGAGEHTHTKESETIVVLEEPSMSVVDSCNQAMRRTLR